MNYQPGDTYRDEIFTLDAADAPVTAAINSTVLVVNGQDSAVEVVTNTDTTGVIKVSASLAGRSVGDVVWVRVNVTVGETTQFERTEKARIDASVNSRAAEDGGKLEDIETRVLTALPNAGPGIENGLPTVDGGGNVAVDKTGFSLSAAGILAIWNQLASATFTVGSLGAKLKAWVLGTDSKALISENTHTAGVTVKAVTEAVATDAASRTASKATATEIRAAVGMAAADLDTQLGGISIKTTNLPASPAATGDAMTLADGAITAAKIADAAITTAKVQTPNDFKADVSTLALQTDLTTTKAAAQAAADKLDDVPRKGQTFRHRNTTTNATADVTIEDVPE